jgi:hypothetical protein
MSSSSIAGLLARVNTLAFQLVSISACQQVSTLRLLAFACQHGGCAALSASQQGLGHIQAEMLRAAVGGVLKC